MHEANETEAREIREQFSKVERRGRGHAFPRALRERATAYVIARRATGGTLVGVAREFGVPWRTLERWANAVKTTQRAPPMVRPVTIAEASASCVPIVVHASRGLRIEGLDLAALAELIARLG